MFPSASPRTRRPCDVDGGCSMVSKNDLKMAMRVKRLAPTVDIPPIPPLTSHGRQYVFLSSAFSCNGCWFEASCYGRLWGPGFVSPEGWRVVRDPSLLDDKDACASNHKPCPKPCRNGFSIMTDCFVIRRRLVKFGNVRH